MDRVIIICIFGVLAFMLASKVLKGGLGFLRIILMAVLFCLFVMLVSRPTDSPGLLPSLAKRLLSENSVPIVAEASGEVLTDEGSLGESGTPTSSVDANDNRSFSTQATLPSSSISRSAEAAFSGSTTTASSNQIEASNPTPTASTQSTPLNTTSSSSTSSSAASDVQPPPYTPPSSASRPINALW